MRFSLVDRYIGKTVGGLILLTTLVLLLITAIITFMDQTRHLGDGNIDFMFLLWYVILLLPGMVVMMFPVGVLIGCVIGLGIMARNSELVVLQSYGLSKTQLILSCCKTIIPMIVLVSLLGQTVVPTMSQYAQNQYAFAESQGRISSTGWNIWMRDGSNFVKIRLITSDNRLYGVVRYEFDGIELKSISDAATAVFNRDDQKWDMFDIKRITYGQRSVEVQHIDFEQWELYLNPERMDIFNMTYSDLTIWELFDYIEYLENNNIESDRYRTDLYKKFVLPIAMIAMLLLGASTVFGSLRSIPMSARVLAGLAMGFMFYMLNELLPNFTYLVGLPPLIGVLIPSVVFIVIALLILNRRI